LLYFGDIIRFLKLKTYEGGENISAKGFGK